MTAPTTNSSANGNVRLLETPATAKDKTNGRACGLHVNSRSGFTLVEVVLALGLCAFALLSLLSLLPVALDSSRKALEISRVAKAFQKVSSDLTQSPFATVTAMSATAATPTPYYFDYDGNTADPLTGTSYTSTSPGTYYTVSATVGASSPIANQSSTTLVRVNLQAKARNANAGSTAITICDMGF